MFSKSLFRKFGLFTIVNVYLVIIAGGVVRCTGSGMGCPDWPKCFGRWVPPTSISELPVNYVETYSHGGQLTVEFNVYKTWTEYINRLLGVFVGFFIFLTLIFSTVYYKTNRPIFYWSLAAFLLVGLQGWIGAKVVATNLKPFIITIHMFIALVIVAILIYVYARSESLEKPKPVNFNKSMYYLSMIACLVSLVQVLIGTQVRQLIDVIALQFNYQSRELWIDQVGNIFLLHRSFAYVVCLLNAYLIYRLHQLHLYAFRNAIAFVLIVEFFSGLALVFFAIPSYIQPVHLVGASILFGLQLLIGIRSFLTNSDEKALGLNNI